MSEKLPAAKIKFDKILSYGEAYEWYAAKQIASILEAEEKEKDSNQILGFTKEVKNKSIDEKKIVVEALWNIIYSDENADMYETNLMRRLSGLLYLDPKVVGDIKEKIKSNQ